MASASSPRHPTSPRVGLDIIHYEDVKVAHEQYIELSLHYNSQWTRDPKLFQTTQTRKASGQRFVLIVRAEPGLATTSAAPRWTPGPRVRGERRLGMGRFGLRSSSPGSVGNTGRVRQSPDGLSLVEA